MLGRDPKAEVLGRGLVKMAGDQRRLLDGNTNSQGLPSKTFSSTIKTTNSLAGHGGSLL